MTTRIREKKFKIQQQKTQIPNRHRVAKYKKVEWKLHVFFPHFHKTRKFKKSMKIKSRSKRITQENP